MRDATQRIAGQGKASLQNYFIGWRISYIDYKDACTIYICRLKSVGVCPAFFLKKREK